MSAAATVCPQCGSSEVHHRQSRGDWVCDVCEHSWQPAAAASDRAAPRPRARVFLSYGRRDAKALADRLRADLEARGYDVWQDTERIRSGKQWDQQIEEGLRDAQVFVALLSPHAMRQTGQQGNPDDLDSVCLDEISFARFARPPKPIVPVMAVPCESPFCIYRLEYIDLTGWKDAEDQYRTGLARLVDAVEAALRGEVRYRSWDHQLRPWDFSAFLNEKRQHFCGREWLFGEIERWRTTSPERALLICGDPGTGKSAIVAELVYRNPGGQVLAYHCCQADTKETLQPGRFVRSLAAMIASQLDDYAARLSDPAVEEALSEASCARDPASAFEAGILTPLEGLAAPPGGVRYLLVDALDEALAPAEGPSRTTIVDVIASRLERLPAWLRLLATTRKERGVLDRLRGLRVLNLDAHDAHNLEDLDRYVAGRLQGPILEERLRASGRSAGEVARVLRDKADGNILYVIRSLEGIERGLYGFDNLDALPPGLYGLYLGFFNRLFADEGSFQPVRAVLEVIVAARRPLTEQRIARATGMDRETELPRVLRRLSAYLHEHEGRYTLYHRSLADWLTAPDQRGSPYYVSRQRGHERLADLFWKEYQQGPRALSDYGLANLPTHLAEAGRWDDLAKILCDLRFVESKCRAGLAYELQADYDAALDAWPGYRRYDPFDRPAPPPLPDWLGTCTAAVLAGNADLHVDKGSGPVLAPLRALDDGRRDPGPQEPRSAPEQRVPDEQFGPDAGSVAALAQMRRTEAAGVAAATVADTAAGRVQAFATFVGTHGHVLSAAPGQTLLTARNHAVAGPVAEQAETLTAALTKPWLSRDPRPPALPVRPACLRTLQGHTNRVNAVALGADARTAVSAGSDSTVRIWNLVSGICLRAYAHRGSVRGVALTADGRTAVSASHDNTLRVWDLGTGNSRVLRGHTNWVNGIAITPDGKLGVSAGADATLRVWDLATGACLRTMQGHAEEVRGIALTEDGRLALSGSADGTLRVWDVATGACLRVLRGHAGPVNGVALTPDGRLAASASRDRTVRLWDVADGACLRALQGYDNWVNGVALTPDGRLAASAGFDLALRVWDAAAGQYVRQLHGHTAWVSDVRLTPDGKLAVSAGSDHTLRVWDVTAGECTRALPGHSAWVGPLAVSPDRKTAVSPSRDQTLRVWDAATGECRHTLTGHGNWVNAVAVTPDSTTGVSTSSDSTLRAWDLATGRCLRTLDGHTDWVHHVALTPDGAAAVSTGSDTTLRVWDLSAGKCLHVLQGHGDWVTYAALTPGGRTAVSASRDHTLRVWDLTTATCLRTLAGHTEYVEGVALTPDGRTAVSASGDTTLRVWDLPTGACRHVLQGHGNYVENVAVTPDGRLALSASRDYTLRVWDLAAGTSLRTLRGHQFGVTAVSVSPDGRLAISAGWDNTVRVWRIATGECLAVYHAGGRVSSALMTLDGRILCGTSDGQVHFLRLHNLEPGSPLVTAVRLFQLPGVVTAGGGWLSALAGLFGGKQRPVTAACPGCGRRFVPARPVLEAVADITGRAALTAEHAPCLALPAEAWAEPRLVSACPRCRQVVQFNPFVVEDRPAGGANLSS
jgi:WD40 repeat protein